MPNNKGTSPLPAHTEGQEINSTAYTPSRHEVKQPINERLSNWYCGSRLRRNIEEVRDPGCTAMHQVLRCTREVHETDVLALAGSRNNRLPEGRSHGGGSPRAGAATRRFLEGCTVSVLALADASRVLHRVLGPLPSCSGPGTTLGLAGVLPVSPPLDDTEGFGGDALRVRQNKAS
ncbi:hypothetical protein FIBSPDRAFT_902405 [Athelia psychrophila]|uniref:Uncharacterized protein n=1 Tax=Athelia psychrophila TaxID=1759441 RepID=A0A167X9K4_9AGAM|nr:hypothetical protein FIBSPDRAFT_902405 [Fibularhizoctonia sp. CBS 109695]